MIAPMSKSPFGKPPAHDSWSDSPTESQSMEVDQLTTEQKLDVPLRDIVKMSKAKAEPAVAKAPSAPCKFNAGH
eukprot:12430343-Karenia_brevis.AAC.1